MRRHRGPLSITALIFPRIAVVPSRTRFNVTRRFSITGRQSEQPDFDAARKWYNNLSSEPLPRNIGEVSYSRSSGPGGQNVNKVNSKAQLRIPLHQLLPLLPTVLHDGVRASHYLAEKSFSLLIQSDESRKQSANKDACYRKLNEIILEIYKKTVPGETSPEQKDRVQRLQKAENEARLQTKKYISHKKAARRGRDE